MRGWKCSQERKKKLKKDFSFTDGEKEVENFHEIGTIVTKILGK